MLHFCIFLNNKSSLHDEEEEKKKKKKKMKKKRFFATKFFCVTVQTVPNLTPTFEG